jgi:hypothetical protein
MKMTDTYGDGYAANTAGEFKITVNGESVTIAASRGSGKLFGVGAEMASSPNTVRYAGRITVFI